MQATGRATDYTVPRPSRWKEASKEAPDAGVFWQAFLEHCPLGAALVDVDGHYIMANSAFQELLGHTEPELRRMLLPDFTDEKILAAHRTPFNDLVEDGRGYFKMEKQYRRKDGSSIWLKLSAFLIPQTHATRAFLIALAEDITEPKRAEEMARSLSDKLFRAQDEERRRLARELHDTTGQNVAAIIMDLSVIGQKKKSLDSEALSALSECVSLAHRSLHEIRTFSYLLHPPMLDEAGLFAAVRIFIDGFSHRSGMRVDLETPDSYTRLPSDLEITLFHVVQEGLTNACRHSQSSWAKVRITVNARDVSVSVENETTAKAQLKQSVVTEAQKGVGIRSMQERVQHFGGRLTFHFDQGRAFLGAILPVSRAKVTSA